MLPFLRRIMCMSTIICSVSFAIHAVSKECVIHADHEEDLTRRIEGFITQPVTITRVDQIVDCAMTRHEFDYLFGIAPESTMTSEELRKGIFYLLRKNKFKEIRLVLEPDGQGYALTCECRSFITVARVVIHGFMFGKERYRLLYMIEPGDRFDQIKHELSLKKIIQQCHQEGYCAARVEERLDYDDLTKTVTVHLFLSRGSRFYFGDVNLKIDFNGLPSDPDFQDILESEYISELSGRYSQEWLNTTAQRIQSALVQRGYADATIHLKEYPEHAASRMNIDLGISINHKRIITFMGNHYFDRAALLGFLAPFGKSLAALPASVVVDELTERYKQAGFFKVAVSAREQAGELLIEIDEGERTKIDAIAYRGLDESIAARVVEKFSSKDEWLDTALLKRLIDAALSESIAHGYAHATYISHTVTSMSNGSNLLEILFQQGPLSIIESIELQVPESFRRDVSFTGQGEPYTPAVLGAQSQMLISIYADTPLEFSSHVTETDHRVKIVWTGVPPQQTYFGKTVIVGSGAIPDHYLMRELRYQERQPFNPDSIKRSIGGLNELDIFDYIHISPYGDTYGFDEQPMILKVVADDPFEARTRLGAGIQYAGKELTYKGLTYKCGAALIYKNPFNAADYFFANADFTRTHRILEAGYWRPWFFSIPVGTTVQLYDNAFKYPTIVGSRQNLYQVTQMGGLLGFDHSWQATQAGFNTGIEWMETVISSHDEDSPFNLKIARAIDFEPALLEKKVPYLMMEPTFFINNLDNTLYPTKGMMTVCSIKGMFPLAYRQMDTFFLKMLAEQSFFIPIARPVVLALRIRCGCIWYQKFSSIMPSERFYLGGGFSIRSYETDMCPPLGIVDTQGERYFVPQGGKSMVNANIELRFPVYKALNGALFQDLGMLSAGGLRELIKEKVLTGTGFGLRYNTPLGPLRFDIGFKWRRPDPSISTFAWFLTFGQAF